MPSFDQNNLFRQYIEPVDDGRFHALITIVTGLCRIPVPHYFWLHAGRRGDLKDDDAAVKIDGKHFLKRLDAINVVGGR